MAYFDETLIIHRQREWKNYCNFASKPLLFIVIVQPKQVQEEGAVGGEDANVEQDQAGSKIKNLPSLFNVVPLSKDRDKHDIDIVLEVSLHMIKSKILSETELTTENGIVTKTYKKYCRPFSFC